MPRVFFSHVTGAARLPFTAAAPPPPASPHWIELASAYRAGLLACGEEVRPILRPEIYQAGVAHELCGAAAGDWHMVVKPIEHIRPFHGLPNVFVSDWPFPSLSRETGGVSPFFNQVRLLNQAAAVACCTEATAAVLRDAGVVRAVHAPPFRPALTSPDTGMLPPRPAAEGCTILAAVEFGSPPELHAPLVQGFAAARALNPLLRLVLLVSGGSGPGAAAGFRAGLLAAAGVEDAGDGIVLVPVPLADALPDWGARADFFLWGGVPLGLPLPLIDAVLAGLPPIAPGPAAAAALGLAPGQFVPVATAPRPVDPADEPVARVMPLWWDVPTPEGVRDACLLAAALDGEERAAMARAARRGAERRFGFDAFRSGLRRLADHLAPVPHGAR